MIKNTPATRVTLLTTLRPSRRTSGKHVKSEFNKTPFTPDDSCKYSPTQYHNINKKSWFLIKNMKEVYQDFLDDCFVEYTNGTSEKLLDVINSQSRLNRVYFNKYSLSVDDENILIK